MPQKGSMNNTVQPLAEGRARESAGSTVLVFNCVSGGGRAQKQPVTHTSASRQRAAHRVAMYGSLHRLNGSLAGDLEVSLSTVTRHCGGDYAVSYDS